MKIKHVWVFTYFCVKENNAWLKFILYHAVNKAVIIQHLSIRSVFVIVVRVLLVLNGTDQSRAAQQRKETFTQTHTRMHSSDTHYCCFAALGGVVLDPLPPTWHGEVCQEGSGNRDVFLIIIQKHR